jgi:hypothetical protein
MLRRKPLAAVGKIFRAAHHAPECDVAGSYAAQDHADFVRSRPDDSNEPPVLDILCLAHPIRFWLPDRLPDAAILLHGARLANDLQREREVAELQHLLRLTALMSIGISQVVKAVRVEHHVGAEVGTADCRVVLKELFGPCAETAVG